MIASEGHGIPRKGIPHLFSIKEVWKENSDPLGAGANSSESKSRQPVLSLTVPTRCQGVLSLQQQPDPA